MGTEVTPRARRLTCEGSDDSDPDVERASDDAMEPLLFSAKPGKVLMPSPLSYLRIQLRQTRSLCADGILA
jgi:hypothetical protein